MIYCDVLSGAAATLGGDLETAAKLLILARSDECRIRIPNGIQLFSPLFDRP